MLEFKYMVFQLIGDLGHALKLCDSEREADDYIRDILQHTGSGTYYTQKVWVDM